MWGQEWVKNTQNCFHCICRVIVYLVAQLALLEWVTLVTEWLSDHMHLIWKLSTIKETEGMFYVFTQPFDHVQDVAQGQYFTRVLLVLIQFSSSLTSYIMKAREPSLPHYLAIDENQWIHVFPKALAQSEIQTTSSRVWTHH